MPELYRFLVVTDTGHVTEYYYGKPHEADAKYDRLCANPIHIGVYYFSAGCGGLVNAYHKPGVVS